MFRSGCWHLFFGRPLPHPLITKAICGARSAWLASWHARREERLGLVWSPRRMDGTRCFVRKGIYFLECETVQV